MVRLLFVCHYRKMAAKQPANSTNIQEGQTSDEIPLPTLEESLLSLEKLDRASPELWPEQNMCDGKDSVPPPDDGSSSNDSNNSFTVPGVSEFASLQNPNQSPPPWNRGLSVEDINYVTQLGSLSTSGLIMEVKKLHDLAYQLGLEEAKEMTRGKYLNIFSSRRQR